MKMPDIRSKRDRKGLALILGGVVFVVIDTVGASAAVGFALVLAGVWHLLPEARE